MNARPALPPIVSLLGSLLLITAACPVVADDEPAVHPPAKYTGVVPVEVRKTDDGWQLLRGGEPFELRGGGVSPGHYAEFAAAGGNSVRTWSTSDAREILDEAHEAGVTVMMGIWLTHPKHGGDYRDEAQNQQRLDEALAAVRAYKDHPALLFWGVGNEVEIQTPNDPAIYQQINRIAREIKKIDPHHPTVIVTAGTGRQRIPLTIEHCPDIDIYGPNIYGRNIFGVVEHIYATGLDKPIIFPEWGPVGQWGRKDNTPWGSVYEPSSTEKALMYLTNWVTTMAAQPDRLLGGYVFYWRYGNKPDDGTNWSTWYSMHHHTGEAFGGVDFMHWAFTGGWPDNLAPAIETLQSSLTGARVDAGTEHTARVVASDRNRDELTYEWVLSPDHEARQQKVRPKFRKLPPSEWLLSGSDTDEVRLRAPDDDGPYRLHVVVRDGKGKAARANVPFYVGDPEAIGPTDLADSFDPNARLTVLVLGDSNAASETGWVRAYERLRGGDVVINRSTPGNTLGFDNLDNPKLNTLKQLDATLDVVDQEAARSPSRVVDVVLINLGTNDSKAVFDGRGDEVVANLRTMIQRLRAHYEFVQAGRTLRIAVVSPPPYGPDDVLAEKYHGGAERVAALVPRFREVTEDMGVTFVDVHRPLAEDFAELAPDGVHMKPEGQQRIAVKVAEAIRTMK